MKQSFKIVLAVTTLLLFNSCIKKVNLYQGKDDEDTENGEGGSNEDTTPIYMYPFDKETTSDMTVEIMIHTDKELQAENLKVEIPCLKYNKSWLLMMTQDDCKHAAFCRTWAAINGKPISNSTPYPTPTVDNPNMKHELYYDVRQLNKGDLPPNIIPASQSLGCTDGTGKEVRFAITTTLAPEEKWMDAETNINLGFTGNYYRFYMKSGLVWDNVKEMLNYGTGIALHDVKAPNVNDPTQILEHFGIAQTIIKEKLSGRGCKFLAEPNGNKVYITAALQDQEIQTITAQNGTTVLYPFKVKSDDLYQTIIHRAFNDSPDYFKEQITTLLKLPKEERSAVHIGVHGTDNNWVGFLNWINNNYGKGGDDSVWFPSQEEYYEYNYRRINSHSHIEKINENTYKLTVIMPGGKSFYYPSTTVNIAGVNILDVVSVESNNVVTGLSYGEHENGIMLNIDCRKYLVEHAEHFVERYEVAPSNTSNKADALYFINMLKESDKKESLKKRIK